MIKTHLHLQESQRVELESLLKAKKLKARIKKRLQALLLLHQGHTLESVSAILSVTNDTVRAWRVRYEKEGVDGLLHEKSRSGRPVKITASKREMISALAQTPPPEGHSQWSLRLLAERVVEIGYCKHISHQWVSQVLKKASE